MAKPNILVDTKGMTETQWVDARMHGPLGDIPCRKVKVKVEPA